MNRSSLPLLASLFLTSGVALACSGAAPAAGPADEFSSQRGRDAGAPVAAPTAGPMDAPSEASGDDFTSDSQSLVTPDQQLIVYTGSLELEVTDIDAAVAQADQVVRGMNGRVAASRASDNEDSKSAYVTYRIPADRWSEALAALKGLAARIVDESIGSEDVTAQVVDLDARLANLRTTEAALQAIMDRATTITDVLKVQSELTKVRGDIERLTAQRDNLANQAAMGTLEVGFNSPAVAQVEQATEGWDLGQEVDNALAALVRVGQWFLSLAIWLAIVIVPIFLPIVVVIFIVYRLRVRWLRTHPTI